MLQAPQRVSFVLYPPFGPLPVPANAPRLHRCPAPVHKVLPDIKVCAADAGVRPAGAIRGSCAEISRLGFPPRRARWSRRALT